MILVLLLLIALIGVTNAVSVKDNVLTYMDLFKDGVITEDEVTKIVLDYMAGRSIFVTSSSVMTPSLNKSM